jgi:site-specific recombinase XerD
MKQLATNDENANAWTGITDRFVRDGIAAGYSPETMRSRLSRIRPFVDTAGLTSMRITAAAAQGWIDRVDTSTASPRAKKDTRVAIRAFARWAHESGLTATAIAPLSSTRVYSDDQRWQDAIELWVRSMRGNKLAAGTVELREKHLKRFAAESKLTPWELTHEDIRGWLDNLERSTSRGTAATHRTSIRAFYLWAFQNGRAFVNPAAEPSRRAVRLDVPDAWAPELATYRQYLRAIGRTERTVADRVDHMRRFARENASLLPFETTLDDLIDWLGTKRWSKESRRKYCSSLRSFYRWAVDTERVLRSPADRLPAVRAGLPKPRPASEKEYSAALASAAPRERLALQLAAELGLRRAEVVSIHSRDITGNHDVWSLTVHGKGNKERTLPLPFALATALRSRPTGYLFPGQFDGHMSPRWMGKLISQLLPEGVTMHALRHRFATRAYSVDRDVFSVQQLLGHSSPATTQRYVLVSDDSLRRLVNAVSA